LSEECEIGRVFGFDGLPVLIAAPQRLGAAVCFPEDKAPQAPFAERNRPAVRNDFVRAHDNGFVIELKILEPFDFCADLKRGTGLALGE
jgi:hypothetical protein